MDFIKLYGPFVAALIFLAVILHLRMMEKPLYRGWWGEYRVNLMLRLCLSNEYQVITNAIYRTHEKGQTTQIDHIVVSRYGMFVLETKSLKGRLMVDLDREDGWLQIVGRRKYKLQNPLYQNYSHIKAVQRVTGVHGNKIHSYVVLAGSGRFEGSMPDRVYSVWGIVRQIQRCRTPVLSRGALVDIMAKLKSRRVRGGYWAAQAHVKRLKQRQSAGDENKHQDDGYAKGQATEKDGCSQKSGVSIPEDR